MPETANKRGEHHHFIIKENLDSGEEPRVVLSTNDPKEAMEVFRKSSSREVIGANTDQVLARVIWEKSGSTIVPNYVVDSIFEADATSIEYSPLSNRPEPAPEQNDLFRTPEVPNHKVVHLDFEPGENQSPLPSEEPPLTIYDDDMSYSSLADVDGERLSYDDYANLTTSESIEPSATPTIDFNETGRWNVVEFDQEGNSAVLFATDDPLEAREALLGYINPEHSGVSINIYDAETKTKAFSIENGSENNQELISPEFEKALSEATENDQTKDNIIDPLATALNEPTPNDLEDNSPSIDGVDYRQEKSSVSPNEVENKWKSSKLSSNSDGLDPEEDELMDDQIFVPSGKPPSRGVQTPQQMVNYKHETNLGKIVRATASGIRNLASIGKTTNQEKNASDGDITKTSVESHFNNSDSGTWQSDQIKRELSVVQQDMSNTFGSIERLNDSQYFRKVQEISESGMPITDEVRRELSRLKADPAFNEALGDVQSFMSNVQARAARLADNRGLSPEDKDNLDKMFSEWSLGAKDKLEQLPDDPSKDDLIERIAKLIEMLIERFSPAKKKEQTNAPSIS